MTLSEIKYIISVIVITLLTQNYRGKKQNKTRINLEEGIPNDDFEVAMPKMHVWLRQKVVLWTRSEIRTRGKPANS